MKTPATLAEAEAQQEEFLHGIATMFVKAGHGDRAKALALIARQPHPHPTSIGGWGVVVRAPLTLGFQGGGNRSVRTLTNRKDMHL